jgi:hypothetical protein
VEFVRDYLTIAGEKKAFEDQLQQNFPVMGDYLYARELRNSIVHRGLDPAMQGTQRGACVFALCPPVVFNFNGKKGYVCSTPLLVDLAATCTKASNFAILTVLEREGLLDAAVHTPDRAQTLEAVSAIPHMPDWAEDMAEEAFATMDFEVMAIEMAQVRIRQLRSLLGCALLV